MSRFLRLPLWVALLILGFTLTQAQGQVKRITRPLLRPAQYQGTRFFPSLKWRVTIGMTQNTVPALADLDLDGTMDLVLAAADGSLYRMTDAGDVKWKVELPTEPSGPVKRAEGTEKPEGDEEGGAAPGQATAGVTLADVDRNGTLDILVAVGQILLCYDADGKERWRAELPAPIHSFPSIADLDGDGSPEVVFGADDNRLHVLTGQGREKWTYETKSWIRGGAATADLNGDGKLEVVFGSMDFNVYCLDSQGQEVWKFETEDWVQSSPCIGDLDHDGRRDVVIASDDGNLYCLSHKGELKWKEGLAGQARTRAYLAVADLDKEGTMETIAALPDGQVMVFTAFGDKAWTRNAGNGSISAAPVIADLNGDGWPDILLATKSGQMVSMDGWGATQWTNYLGHSIEATPVLADVNRNGKYEIYVSNLIVSNRRIGFFSQYEISVPGGRAQWAGIKGDPYRTGYAPNALDYGAALKRGSDYATAWEPFLAGARPQQGLPAPRRLRIAALPLLDNWGNRDGALDPGERALFRIQVTNDGRGASYDSLLTVDFGKSALTLDRTRAYLGWVAPRATKTVTFKLTAPPLSQVAKGKTYRDLVGAATARMEVRESGVQAAVSEARVLQVPALPPVLKVVRWSLQDNTSPSTSGNGNHRLDAGESAVLRLVVQNANLTTAPSATARLTSDSADVLVATPTVSLNRVVPYGGRNIAYSLRVARQLKGRKVTLTLTTQSPGAPPHVDRITLPLQPAPTDTKAPTIALTSPASRIALTRQAQITISGTVQDPSDVGTFSFEGKPVLKTDLGRLGPNRYRFRISRALKVGENVFPITATDTLGNSNTLWIRVVRKP